MRVNLSIRVYWAAACKELIVLVRDLVPPELDLFEEPLPLIVEISTEVVLVLLLFFSETILDEFLF